MISRVFPSYHKNKGELTRFEQKIRNKNKIHTIRANYEKWKRKIDQIKNGEAVLSIREWQGVPYHSKQNYLFYYNQEDALDVSKLTKDENGYLINDIIRVSEEELAKNDGLTLDEFQEWFKVFPSEPMAIIHFSGFRYEN